MRFLVTGANGLVGSRLCALLAARGHPTTGLSRGERRAQGAFAYLPCELTDEAQVRARFAEVRPEVVIHPASMTEVDRCEKAPDEAYAANVSAAAFVARATRDAGAHLVHVSTDYVFDGDAGPYAEDALPHPRGAYAITKHMGEEAVRVLCPSWAIARTAVVYGWPRAGRPNFGAWLVGELEQGRPVKLFQDQFVSPSLADHVAEMLAELGERRLPGIWNTAGAEVVDRMAFGRALCQVFGFDPALLTATKLREMNLASPRPLHSGLRPDKAAGALAARPLGLAESLARFHRAYVGTKEGGAR